VALRHPEFVDKSKADFVDMKAQIREVLTPSTVRKLKKHADAEYEEVKIHGASSGHLHMAETLDTNSLLLLYHDDKNINLYNEFLKRKVLVIDGYDFKGLDSNSARVRLPRMEEFPVLLQAIKEINEL
jgi:histidinol-phosphate aminotransferase